MCRPSSAAAKAGGSCNHHGDRQYLGLAPFLQAAGGLGSMSRCRRRRKYIVGHSDALLGTIAANAENFSRKLAKAAGDLGIWTGPDDMYLAQRGLRTLAVRLARHQENGAGPRPLSPGPAGSEARAASGPARRSRPCPLAAGFHRCQRAVRGCVAPGPAREGWRLFLDGLEFFGMGWSWGGYEKPLRCPSTLNRFRTARPWTEAGPPAPFSMPGWKMSRI